MEKSFEKVDMTKVWLMDFCVPAGLSFKGFGGVREVWDHLAHKDVTLSVPPAHTWWDRNWSVTKEEPRWRNCPTQTLSTICTNWAICGWCNQTWQLQDQMSRDGNTRKEGQKKPNKSGIVQGRVCCWTGGLSFCWEFLEEPFTLS